MQISRKSFSSIVKTLADEGQLEYSVAFQLAEKIVETLEKELPEVEIPAWPIRKTSFEQVTVPYWWVVEFREWKAYYEWTDSLVPAWTKVPWWVIDRNNEFTPQKLSS